MSLEMQYVLVFVFSLLAIVMYVVWMRGNQTAVANQANSLADSALLAKQSNDLVKAQMLLEQALQMLEKMSNPDTSKLISCLLALAECYEKNSKFPEARNTYKKVLDLWRSMLTDPHQNTFDNIDYFIAKSNFGSARSDVASFYQIVVLQREKIYGPKHPDIIRSKRLLVRLLNDAGRKQEAKQLEDSLEQPS